jgi:hypothetical protein
MRTGDWSRGMILDLEVSGPGFNSGITPFFYLSRNGSKTANSDIQAKQTQKEDKGRGQNSFKFQ